MYYRVDIEDREEEFVVIDEAETLEEAIKIARSVDERLYRAIMIYKIYEDGKWELMEVEI